MCTCPLFRCSLESEIMVFPLLLLPIHFQIHFVDSFYSPGPCLSHVSVVLQRACPCFHAQWTYFLQLSSVRSSPFRHLPCLLDLLHIKKDHLSVLKKMSWKIHWLPGPLPLQGRSLLEHAQEIPEWAALLKARLNSGTDNWDGTTATIFSPGEYMRASPTTLFPWCFLMVSQSPLCQALWCFLK